MMKGKGGEIPYLYGSAVLMCDQVDWRELCAAGFWKAFPFEALIRHAH